MRSKFACGIQIRLIAGGSATRNELRLLFLLVSCLCNQRSNEEGTGWPAHYRAPVRVYAWKG